MIRKFMIITHQRYRQDTNMISITVQRTVGSSFTDSERVACGTTVYHTEFLYGFGVLAYALGCIYLGFFVFGVYTMLLSSLLDDG